MPFTFKTLSIPDIILIELKVFLDDRGFFFESFKTSDFEKANLPTHFVQDNFSFSKRTLLRPPLSKGPQGPREPGIGPQRQRPSLLTAGGAFLTMFCSSKPTNPTVSVSPNVSNAY